ncbi:MAG TPA: hypothetical protein VNR39_04865 [Pseudolabrys sp.]|nr:hypothetical protein [Pseudolabrys sp.]
MKHKPSKLSSLNITAAAALAAALFATPAARAGDVRLYVLAPQPPASLKTVETQGAGKPLYSHSYDIPYASVEQQIRNEIKKSNIDLGGTVVCSGACPDVHWHVSVTTDFSFTQKNQPVVTAFGDAQENGVKVSLQTQFKLHTVISARVWANPVTGEVSGKVDIPVDLLIGLQADSQLGIWPEIKSIASLCDTTKQMETVCVHLPLADKNIDLSDAHGAAVAIGTALGGLIGASPLAVGIGDPLSGMLVGALISNEAAKIAEQKVQDEATKAINAALNAMSIRATWLAEQYVDAKVAQVNAVKSKLLDTKLPGVNKSLTELASALGLSVDVETTTSGSDVNVIVTPRFAAASAGMKLTGKFRMPKEACVYAGGSWGYLPMGLVKVNEDLAGKAGTSCASLLPAANFKTNGYLGANPASLKLGGKSLPLWQSAGTPSFTGAMTIYTHATGEQTQPGFNPHQPTGYYECGFEIANVPHAAIIEAVVSGTVQERLTGYFDKASRYVEVTAGGPQLVVDNEWKTMDGGFVIGGEGQCGPGRFNAPRYQPASWLDHIKDLFDPGKCAACNIKLNQGMLEITNPEVVLQSPALKPMFDALMKGEALPAAVKAPVTQTPAGQHAPAAGGVQRAPVLAPQLQRPGAQMGVEKPK